MRYPTIPHPYISRKQSIRWSFGIVAAYIVLVVIIVRLRMHPNALQSENAEALIDGATSKIMLHQFERSETRGDKKLWQVKAASGELFPEINKTRLRDFEMETYQEDGTTIRMTAPQGLLSLEGTGFKSAYVSDGVVVYYGKEYIIRTQAASYLKAENSVTSDSRTTIEGENLKVSGDSLSADVNSKTLFLKGHVTTFISGKARISEGAPLPGSQKRESQKEKAQNKHDDNAKEVQPRSQKPIRMEGKRNKQNKTEKEARLKDGKNKKSRTKN